MNDQQIEAAIDQVVEMEYATAEDQSMIDKMNSFLELTDPLTLQDYDDWLDAGTGFAKFDDAVRSILGDLAYTNAEQAARMSDAFLYAMGIRKSADAGGVDLRRLGVRRLK